MGGGGGGGRHQSGIIFAKVNNCSSNMEPAAARASIAFIQEAGVVINVFVTDRYYSIW